MELYVVYPNYDWSTLMDAYVVYRNYDLSSLIFINGRLRSLT